MIQIVAFKESRKSRNYRTIRGGDRRVHPTVDSNHVIHIDHKEMQTKQINDSPFKLRSAPGTGTVRIRPGSEPRTSNPTYSLRAVLIVTKILMISLF